MKGEQPMQELERVAAILKPSETMLEWINEQQTEEDEKPVTQKSPKSSRKMISQQNKKSVIKVTEPIKKNYFAD